MCSYMGLYEEIILSVPSHSHTYCEEIMRLRQGSLTKGFNDPEVSPIRKDVSNVPKFGTFGMFGTFEMSFQSV